MAWWDFLKEFLYSSILKRPEDKNGDEVSKRVGLREGALDWLYFWLGIFTHLYGATLTLLFFAQVVEEWPILVGVLDALQEPYLGGLGVYVVLKEIRKRVRREESKHYGEYFVFLWFVLLITATATVLLSPHYRFNEVYKLIVTNSLATFIIYIGGLINRP